LLKREREVHGGYLAVSEHNSERGSPAKCGGAGTTSGDGGRHSAASHVDIQMIKSSIVGETHVMGEQSVGE